MQTILQWIPHTYTQEGPTDLNVALSIVRERGERSSFKG